MPGGLALLVTLAAVGPAPASSPEPREIPVVFALPAALHGRPVWRRDLGHAVSEATRVLGPHLRARFVLSEVVTWRPRGRSVEELLDALPSQAPPAVGRIVVGVVEGEGTGSTAGLASYRDGLAVIAVSSPGWERIFVHELAHLFGAVHSGGTRDLMAPGAPGLRLDERNARLVAVHRRRRLAPHLYPLPAEDREAASALYRQAASSTPLEAGLQLAQLALEEGEPQAALEAAERLLGEFGGAQSSGGAEAHNLRGIALRRLGRPREAVTAYQEALKRRPGYAPFHYNLAIAFDHLGDTPQALGAYERAIELDPGHANALSNLARVLARHGDPRRAVAFARRGLGIAPDFSEARVNLALALIQAGEVEAALAEARRCVAERPDLAESHEVLGGALLAARRPRDAAECFGRASALRPEEPRFRQQLAVALLGVGRQQRATGDAEALAALERAALADPTSADVISELAELRFERGIPGPARDAYEHLLALRPDDGAAHNNLAVLLFRAGDARSARQHVDQALRLGIAVHPDFLTALAQAERR